MANPNQQYIDALNKIYSTIMNRGAFSYDMENDPLYKQYAKQYTQLGKQAMVDTTAQSAALTGGYGNSWATSAGAQAYQGYLDQLNDKIPELRNQAYNEWLNEGDMLLQQYNLAAQHPSTLKSLTPTSAGGRRGTAADPGEGDYVTNATTGNFEWNPYDAAGNLKPAIASAVEEYKKPKGNARSRYDQKK